MSKGKRKPLEPEIVEALLGLSCSRMGIAGGDQSLYQALADARSR